MVCCALIAFARVSAAETVDLTPSPQGMARVRVKTTVQMDGSLKLNPTASGENSTSLPLKVAGELFFDERNLPHGSVRHYWEAKAELTVGEGNTPRRLRDQRKLIGVSRDDDHPRPIFYSLGGPLTREELELIEISGSGFSPESLLPGKQVAPGDHWKHTDAVTRGLLNVDEIDSGDLTSKVSSIEPETAKIELSGEVVAAVEGVETTIEVAGTYQFDRSRKIVKWLALSLKERRRSGFAAPGFEVVAQIQSARQSIDQSEALPDGLVSGVNPRPSAPDLMLEFMPTTGKYQLLFDRRWHVLSEQANAATLRLVDDGDLVATCKIDRLTKMTSGQRVSLPAYEQDVRRALDKNCEQIMEAEESATSKGIQILRVAAAGKAGDVPVRWVYYHLADDNGHRLSFVFTHEASLADRFAGVDQALVNTVEFRAPVQDQQARQRGTELR